jgi:hypothetical protein
MAVFELQVGGCRGGGKRERFSGKLIWTRMLKFTTIIWATKGLKMLERKGKKM